MVELGWSYGHTVEKPLRGQRKSLNLWGLVLMNGPNGHIFSTFGYDGQLTATVAWRSESTLWRRWGGGSETQPTNVRTNQEFELQKKERSSCFPLLSDSKSPSLPPFPRKAQTLRQKSFNLSEERKCHFKEEWNKLSWILEQNSFGPFLLTDSIILNQPEKCIFSIMK